MDIIAALSLMQLQLYTANGTAGWVASSSRNVSNGLWHSVVAEKVGDTSRLIVDGAVGADASAPSILRTNSALYIGGLPSEFVSYAKSVRTLEDVCMAYDSIVL